MAWDAREFLRRKLIGKKVSFAVSYSAGAAGREFGVVYLDKGMFLVPDLLLLRGFVCAACASLPHKGDVLGGGESAKSQPRSAGGALLRTPYICIV